jgi:putative tricarboxylic transport membrane protein
MRRTDQITGVLLLLLAIAFGVGAQQLRYYTSLGPGPGFFPSWLSALLAGLAVLMVLQATFGRSEPAAEPFLANRAGYLRMAAVVLALLATIVLMDWLGFRLTLLLVLVFLLVSLGRHGPVVIAIIALAGSFGAYHVFVAWLHVALPRGSFGF